MPRRLLLPVLAVAALIAPVAADAATGPYRAGEVVVRYSDGTPSAAQAQVQKAVGSRAVTMAAPQTHVLHIRRGQSVARTVATLRRHRDVAWAAPNPIAHVSGGPPLGRAPGPLAGFVPNDPGRGGPAGWERIQWNFLPGYGVNAPQAWANDIAAGNPGGRGVVIAVLDTGVAYRNAGRFRRSPDFVPSQFVPGYDFVGNDPHPDDYYGHGTFVAGIIAERTNNRRYLTGLAYGAKIMPVRVLDAHGYGDAVDIARGIRFATRHHARIINLSLEFDVSTPASSIPEILSAIRYAQRRGVLVVAASGNASESRIAYPARAPQVLSVGATTEHGCVADYSNEGRGLDLVAPGGGADSSSDPDPSRCRPFGRSGRDIYQLTFDGSVRRFGMPGGYEGTSMAAPHVAAAAALVIASRVIGSRPSATAIKHRLEQTARDLGPKGYDRLYGYGLLDVGAATSRATAARRRR